MESNQVKENGIMKTAWKGSHQKTIGVTVIQKNKNARVMDPPTAKNCGRRDVCHFRRALHRKIVHEI
jgi:hypothetical protein